MFRSRGENLHSVFILLFLNVAFFMLEHQDPEKFARLFRFDWNAVRGGEVWRVATWQFTQAGQGWVEALSLFITLVLLYMMGSALEEEWGTFHFLTFWGVSTLATAGTAAWLGVPLLATYFVYFTLLFVYASAFPEHTFYLLGAMPVRVRLLAVFAFGVLFYGVIRGGAANKAALAGAAAGYVYYLSQRIRIVFVDVRSDELPPVRIDTTAIHNAARFAAMKQALTRDSETDVERLIGQCDRDTVPNVNICPPADYKPENNDGYCIRCEGFAECSARYLRLNRPERAPQAQTAPQSL